jgi:hypothetical protein
VSLAALALLSGRDSPLYRVWGSSLFFDAF